MILPCEECKEVFDIPEKECDEWNIYRIWNGVGSPVMCPPKLLCHKCTDMIIERSIL